MRQLLFSALFLSSLATATTVTSSEIGTWIERTPLAGGRLLLRHIRVDRTETTVLDRRGTLLSRTAVARRYSRTRGEFTDDDLRQLVHAGGRGILYAWSPSMPLSELGKGEIAKAAVKLGMPVTYVLDPRAEGQGSRESRRLESWDLIFRGMRLHYPSIAVYAGGRILGAVIPGFHTADGYTRLLNEWLTRNEAVTDFPGVKESSAPVVPIKTTPIKTIETTLLPGYFFKVTANGRWASFRSDRGENYLFDLEMGRSLLVPGHFDPVPSPDGRYLTIPGPLRIFSMASLLAAVQPEQEKPLLEDLAMGFFYQTIAAVGPDTYRVLVGMDGGALIRDYTKLKPVSPVARLCRNREISLPILSKDGKEMAARDNRAGATAIFAISIDGSCRQTHSLGFATGKAALDYSGTRIAFAAEKVRTDAGGSFSSPSALTSLGAFVCDRDGNDCTRVDDSIEGNFDGDANYPEFLENGQVIYLKIPKTAGAKRSFHVVKIH